jgi:hypothetical protein
VEELAEWNQHKSNLGRNKKPSEVYLKKTTKLVVYPSGQYICNINENSFKTSQTMQISSSKSILSKILQERCLQTQNLPVLTHNFARKDPTQLHILPLQQCELNPDT